MYVIRVMPLLALASAQERCEGAVSLLQIRMANKLPSFGADSVPRPVVLYGIESNGKPDYEAMMAANLETWAGTVPRDHLVVVGGSHDDYLEGLADEASPCEEGRLTVDCKEATLLHRGVDRARKLGADWMVVGQDDKFIWTENVRLALSHFDASEPRVYGSFGCGQAWKFHKGSTFPPPSGFVKPAFSCDAVWERGGLCGGDTYFVSRGALELLTRGQDLAGFIREFTSPPAHAASDLSASCLFYDRGIPQGFEDKLSGRTRSMPSYVWAGSEQALSEVVARLKEDTRGAPPLAIHLDSLEKASIAPLVRILNASAIGQAVALLHVRAADVDGRMRYAQARLALFRLLQAEAWIE